METRIEKEPAPSTGAWRLLRIAAGFAISGVFVYLCLRQVDLSRVGAEIVQVNWPVVSLSLVSRFLGFVCASAP